MQNKKGNYTFKYTINYYGQLQINKIMTNIKIKYMKLSADDIQQN